MDTHSKVYKSILRGLFFILINLLFLLPTSYAGYYFVSSGVIPDQVIYCCEEPAHYSPSKQKHKKRSSYQIDVYYVWYTYSGAMWIPSSCGTCGAPKEAIKRSDCQFVYTPDHFTEGPPEIVDEDNENFDTRTLDDVDNRY